MPTVTTRGLTKPEVKKPFITCERTRMAPFARSKTAYSMPVSAPVSCHAMKIISPTAAASVRTNDFVPGLEIEYRLGVCQWVIPARRANGVGPKARRITLLSAMSVWLPTEETRTPSVGAVASSSLMASAACPDRRARRPTLSNSMFCARSRYGGSSTWRAVF
ncbi:MAG TPA: hypothetical protein VFU97_24470 [Xanthobacteraceae bacterium]|nr:hypothetical protein [Xanthobacteraceae bacterium]